MRLLFLTPRPPWPGRRGDQVRAAGLIEGLAARHEVHVVCQRWPGYPAVRPSVPLAGFETVDVSRRDLFGRAAVAGLGSVFAAQPIQAGLFAHASFARAARLAIDSVKPDAVVVVLSRLGTLARELAAELEGDGVPVVVDLIDALGANMRRRAARQPALAWLWRREARRLERFDARVIASSTWSTVVAERDRQALASDLEVDLHERLRVVPYGLDVPNWLEHPHQSGPRDVIALTGNLGYFPTVDAARWFAESVWPRLKKQRPALRWQLAGARPGAELRALARAPGIELLADPPDLASVLASSTVAIAPLFAGSGTPIKILEAMVAGIPVVTTTDGRAGLDDLPEGALAVADHPEAFADAVEALLADEGLRRQRAEVAWKWLRQRHHLPRVVERFEALLTERATDARQPGQR